MKYIQPKIIIFALIAFIVLNFPVRIISLLTVGNFVLQILPESGDESIYIAFIIASFVTGAMVGWLINILTKKIPLYHAAVVAILAALYKVVNPDIDTLPISMVAVLSLSTMIAIIVGTKITNKNKT